MARKKHYTVPEFFDAFPEITRVGVAKLAGIAPSVMRQYSCGYRKVPVRHIKAIDKAVRKIGTDLSKKKIV